MYFHLPKGLDLIVKHIKKHNEIKSIKKFKGSIDSRELTKGYVALYITDEIYTKR
jgi:hypothetical protein